MRKTTTETVRLDKIVGGGQTLGALADGRKVFVWGGLPGEMVEVMITKKKSSMAEGVVTRVLQPAPERIEPKDPDSYLSTSPWQIMSDNTEDFWKHQLVKDAFALHHIDLPEFELVSDGKPYGYRNKVEFSWYWDTEADTLDLAFFRRGTKGKIPVQGTSLARPEVNAAAIRIRNLLRRLNIEARELKTVLIRCDQAGSVVAQLYVKDETFQKLSEPDIAALHLQGFELIYSFPKSPASVITKRLQQWGNITLQDTVLGIPFNYASEGFFQVNIPVYELALDRMKQWTGDTQVVDMYAGVGTIGLTIGGNETTLVELNELCVREMKRNIDSHHWTATAVNAASEDALEHIQSDKTIIVDPPRAGLHDRVVERLLETRPQRIIYLSCNPATQARDVEKLLAAYKLAGITAYNFFPRTPHIENLAVLELDHIH